MGNQTLHHVLNLFKKQSNQDLYTFSLKLFFIIILNLSNKFDTVSERVKHVKLSIVY